MEFDQDDQITKEFLRGCLDHTSAAVYAKDREGRYLFFNAHFFDLFGVNALGKTDYDLFEPQVADLLCKVDREVMQTGRPVDCEETVPSRGGPRVYWSVKFPLRDARGNVYGLGGISSDITSRKQTEHDRDASLALLDTFLSGSPVGFAVLDRESRYVRVNETLARLNGMPVEAHLGRRVRDVLPELPEEIEAAIGDVWQSGQPLVNMEASIRTRAVPEVVRSFLVSFYPIVIADETIALGAVLSDISQQKRAAEQLEREAELRDLFMGVLAHDLRTPLSSITMSAQAMMLRDDMPEVGMRSARRIVRAAQRMSALIKQVLDFTRMRAGGGLVLAPTPLDLGELCTTLLEEFRAARPERSLQLRGQGDLMGTWDGDRLGQLIGNLVNNALTHGAPESPVVVRLSGEAADQVVLSVHNQGPPIPEALMGTLFEPFRRGAGPTARTSEEGLGLGLYISERIAFAHGGSIAARSDADETVFTVRLPRETTSGQDVMATR
ncbi:MAG: PAS domain-containing sensor histidine kinase [Myxococcales bacterium]